MARNSSNNPQPPIPTADEEALQAPTIDPTMLMGVGLSQGIPAALKTLVAVGGQNALLGGLSDSIKRKAQYVEGGNTGNVVPDSMKGEIPGVLDVIPDKLKTTVSYQLAKRAFAQSLRTGQPIKPSGTLEFAKAMGGEDWYDVFKNARQAALEEFLKGASEAASVSGE